MFPIDDPFELGKWKGNVDNEENKNLIPVKTKSDA